LPAARLQPLPFLDPERLITLLDQDPSLIEPGLRIIARGVPLPASLGPITLDALASDAGGGAAAIRIVECVLPRTVEEALTARAYLLEHLPTLRALCPALAGPSSHIRCLILAGAISPAAASLVSLLTDPAPEIFEIGAFDSPSGLAISVRRPARAARASERSPSDRGAVSPAPIPARGDPLSGLPLTAEEALEFGRIAAAHPPPNHRPGAAGADPLPGAAARPAPSRSSFQEN